MGFVYTDKFFVCIFSEQLDKLVGNKWDKKDDGFVGDLHFDTVIKEVSFKKFTTIVDTLHTFNIEGVNLFVNDYMFCIQARSNLETVEFKLPIPESDENVERNTAENRYSVEYLRGFAKSLRLKDIDDNGLTLRMNSKGEYPIKIDYHSKRTGKDEYIVIAPRMNGC